MSKDKFDELIERANKDSKDDILKFAKGVYDIDEEFYDYMWNVPVIASYAGDTLLAMPLCYKTEDELLDIIDIFIADELGNEDGCFTSLDKMQDIFYTDEVFKKWIDNLEKEQFKDYARLEPKKREFELKKKFKEFINNEFGKWYESLGYNSIIVYNAAKIQKEYKELLKSKTKANTQEELDQIFVDYVKGIITHERCHLNANYFVTEVDKYTEEGMDKAELSSSEVNCASLTNIEQSNIITSGKDTAIINKYNEERNEVLVDTLAQMMNNYQKGDSVEDCLFRIIKNRNGKSQYEKLDDREVLTMYTLFPEELTEWAIFGAYDFIRENKLRKMIIEVCGTDVPLKPEQLNEKVKEYVKTLEKGTLSEKQTEMLKMLGVSVSKKIGKEDVKEVATSEKALGALSGSMQDIKKLVQKDNSIIK